jgi:hypothetical protein
MSRPTVVLFFPKRAMERQNGVKLGQTYPYPTEHDRRSAR